MIELDAFQFIVIVMGSYLFGAVIGHVGARIFK